MIEISRSLTLSCRTKNLGISVIALSLFALEKRYEAARAKSGRAKCDKVLGIRKALDTACRLDLYVLAHVLGK